MGFRSYVAEYMIFAVRLSFLTIREKVLKYKKTLGKNLYAYP